MIWARLIKVYHGMAELFNIDQDLPFSIDSRLLIKPLNQGFWAKHLSKASIKADDQGNWSIPIKPIKPIQNRLILIKAKQFRSRIYSCFMILRAYLLISWFTVCFIHGNSWLQKIFLRKYNQSISKVLWRHFVRGAQKRQWV